jgi:hypothetical protein
MTCTYKPLIWHYWHYLSLFKIQIGLHLPKEGKPVSLLESNQIGLHLPIIHIITCTEDLITICGIQIKPDTEFRCIAAHQPKRG